MYALCKEMRDGIGLDELAACAGLSKSLVDKFITHSHARNNRAVLFNLAYAMIIHLIDMTLLEDASISEELSKLQRKHAEKQVSVDNRGASANFPLITTHSNNLKPSGILYEATAEVITEDIITLGARLKERIKARFSVGPNGKHFVDTVLFSSLLPTIGFHVLSRTGYTNVVESFWFKHNAVLHSSTYLKYQELSLFYAFFRGILLSFFVHELSQRTPGPMVMKLLSFTGRGKHDVDGWGFGYTHSDETLEMLIVRNLKSLSVNFLGHLENFSAWLMHVLMFKALIRYMTGASRSYGRKRQESDGGEARCPVAGYDRNTCQWRTVARMLHFMREAGFMNVAHRSWECLMNVFSNPHKMLNIKADQDGILSIAERGSVTAEMHASVLFPDVFDELTEQDKNDYFGGKKLKKWTKSRAVLHPTQSMAKFVGVVLCVPNQDYGDDVLALDHAVAPKRPRVKEAFSRILQDRRKKITNMKDLFHAEERRAINFNDVRYLKEAMGRWERLHSQRHLISAFADCFVDYEGRLNHGTESRFLEYTTRGKRDTRYPFNETLEARSEETSHANASTSTHAAVSRNLFRTGLSPYGIIQIDVMNALHYRGYTGHRGTSLREVATGKMKSVLRPWITGPRGECLEQIHLHIDDPSLVLPQKNAEQRRRDKNGRKSGDADNEESRNESILNFDEELNVQWSSLLTDRRYKGELASLHLFFGAIASFELLQEEGRQCSVYLHGGSFVVSSSFGSFKPAEFVK